jgi:hypothetical protein
MCTSIQHATRTTAPGYEAIEGNEFEKLPHVGMISDADWDPSMLDHDINDTTNGMTPCWTMEILHTV